VVAVVTEGKRKQMVGLVTKKARDEAKEQQRDQYHEGAEMASTHGTTMARQSIKHIHYT
jgi:hypothetical protein